MHYKKNTFFHYLVVIFLSVIFSCKTTNHNPIVKPIRPDKPSKLIVLTKEEIALQQKYAELLEVEPEAIQNSQLYQFVDDWLNVKYKYAGVDKKGVDCSGLANALYFSVYNKEIPRASADIASASEKVALSDLKEGDFVFFSIKSGRIDHVGVYLANKRFVHSSTSKGVIISNLAHPYYAKYFTTGGRIL